MHFSDDGKQSNPWRMATLIFVVAAVINYVWELAQSPLYVGMQDFRRMLWHCLPASLGDGLLVLFIFAVGWLISYDRDWIVRPGIRGYAVMLITGLIVAVSIELIAVHLLGRWAYSARMPLLPALNVGLAPIAQMLVLPPLIFRVVAQKRRHDA